MNLEALFKHLHDEELLLNAKGTLIEGIKETLTDRCVCPIQIDIDQGYHLELADWASGAFGLKVSATGDFRIIFEWPSE